MKKVESIEAPKQERAPGAGRKLNSRGKTPTLLVASLALEISTDFSVPQKEAIILATNAIEAVFLNGKMIGEGEKLQTTVRQAISDLRSRGTLSESDPRKTDGHIHFGPAVKAQLRHHVIAALEKEGKKTS